MPVNGTTHRFGNDESDAGTIIIASRDPSVTVDNEIGLRCTHPMFDGVSEIGRPCHPVSSREHWLCDRQVRQSENDGPCGADPPRWHGRRGYACATGNRGPWPDAGCSAERSACPWPPLFSSSSDSPDAAERCAFRAPGLPLVKALFRTGAVPGLRSLPCRRRLGDCSRVLRTLLQVKPHRFGTGAIGRSLC